MAYRAVVGGDDDGRRGISTHVLARADVVVGLDVSAEKEKKKEGGKLPKRREERWWRVAKREEKKMGFAATATAGVALA